MQIQISVLMRIRIKTFVTVAHLRFFTLVRAYSCAEPLSLYDEGRSRMTMLGWRCCSAWLARVVYCRMLGYGTTAYIGCEDMRVFLCGWLAEGRQECSSTQ